MENTVDYTIVNGKIVVKNGIIQTIDENNIYNIANETENKYLLNK